MNTSVTNFIKTPKTKQRFTNETKQDRKNSHKAMQQDRRLARSNKSHVRYMAQ